MWQDPSGRVFPGMCAKCRFHLSLNDVNGKIESRCSRCKEFSKIKEVISCTGRCKFHHYLCYSCASKGEDRGWILEGKQEARSKKQVKEESSGPFNLFIFGIVFVLIISVAVHWYSNRSAQNLGENLRRLKKDFPSQRNETWYHIFSALEKDIPAVKSITLLHGDHKETSDCLTKELVLLYTGNRSLTKEEIVFSEARFVEKDYGFALEHYFSLVKEFRILVTDLTNLPGKTARVFHSLCDEVSSNIKPSLFIFTLKFDESIRNLKPLTRAETILKEIWRDLPGNEIFPLISRILKNVVDIVPEEKVSC